MKNLVQFLATTESSTESQGCLPLNGLLSRQPLRLPCCLGGERNHEEVVISFKVVTVVHWPTRISGLLLVGYMQKTQYFTKPLS